MNTEGLIAAAEGLVKELQGRINGGRMDLQEAEAKILEMVNWIGDEMVQEVVAGLAEPTSANQITVGGEVARTVWTMPVTAISGGRSAVAWSKGSANWLSVGASRATG